jgi:general secretion pathway protein H
MTRAGHRSRHLRAGACGFTLLELLVVLMLMAVIAGFTVPMFTGVSTTALKGAARELAAALKQARSEAIATRVPMRVMLDLEERSFQVDGNAFVHRLPKGVELKLFTAQSDIVTERVGGIRFFPDGGSNGGRVTIAVGERKYEVDVDWLTGRVAILD